MNLLYKLIKGLEIYDRSKVTWFLRDQRHIRNKLVFAVRCLLYRPVIQKLMKLLVNIFPICYR